MAKFKRGQLVEVTKSSKGNKGHRFVVTVAEVDNGIDGTSYRTDMYSAISKGKCLWAAEGHLKLVNPDGDDKSEFTFDELMSDLRRGVKV